jgi:rhamnulokinase
MSDYLAIDLGAESGRIIRGSLRGGKLLMKEIHRFSNGAIKHKKTLRWDFPRLMTEIELGLKKAANNGAIKSIGCDSWGVDYVLINRSGKITDLPFCYRDERTTKTFSTIQKKLSPRKIFNSTGIGSLSINTLYQLYADLKKRPKVLADTDKFLLIADAVSWKLTDKICAEETLVSGSQCWNTRTNEWSWSLLKKLKLPESIFPPTVKSGRIIAKISPSIEKKTDLKNVKVVAVCAHDTASAVAAVPAPQGNQWAYLSSGTWSLLGVELNKPLINEAVRCANFTNEVGYNRKTRFLKCLVGLWILQECRREWIKKNKNLDYTQITHAAQKSPELRSLIRPDNSRFSKVGGMIKKIQDYCRETGQPIPKTIGEISRCILDSLALLYREELDGLEKLTHRKIKQLHIVGGGCRNEVLNQATANASGRTIVTGPVEATAMGNILVQAIAMKELKNIDALRKVVRRSSHFKTFKPQSPKIWSKAYSHFKNLPKF